MHARGVRMRRPEVDVNVFLDRFPLYSLGQGLWARAG